jgi:hypothetical protein
MLKPTNTNRQPLAILMLIMVVWQSLFIAVEAGAHAQVVADIHHQAPSQQHLKIGQSCSETPCTNGLINPADGHVAEGIDSCDHCCACQGHGAHVSIYIKAFSLAIAPPRHCPVAHLIASCSFHPPSIYRPPIV